MAYKFCPNCSHLNGNFEETKEFIEKIYTLDEGEYSLNYTDKAFFKRVEDIYAPKVSFLRENIFQEVFPRQLGGTHTHLFTEKSIQEMNNILRVHSISEWRFGTDIMDLYRSIKIILEKNKTSEAVFTRIEEGFLNSLDEIQSILDRNHFCSEIHCLVSKK